MTSNPYESPHLDGGAQKPAKGPWGLWLKLGLLALAAMILVGLLLPARRNMPEAARRTQCLNNLKQISLALNNFESAHKTFPPAYTVDADGKKLHSWRALILPYLEQQELYDKIDFSKSWDHPANEEARKASVPSYTCPSLRRLPDGHTTYLAVVAPDSCFPGSETRTYKDITDGTSNTLLVVEVCASQALHWMDPTDANASMIFRAAAQDATAKEDQPPHSAEIFNCARCDGSVQSVAAENVTDATRRALISINGNDKVEFEY